MLSISGLSSSKYALYMLNKKLVGPLEALWQEYISLGKDGKSDRTLTEGTELDSILEILDPIEFDRIDENSRNLYPTISVDLLKVVIIYHRSVQSKNVNAGVDSKQKYGQVIRRVWEFCYRIMTIQDSNSIASYEQYISFLLTSLPEVLKCLNNDGETSDNDTKGLNINGLAFIAQYVQLATKLLGYSTNDKKWFLLFLETNLDGCVSAYNLLLNSQDTVPSAVLNMNSTVVQLVLALDDLIAACLLDPKAIEEIVQLSTNSVHAHVSTHVTQRFVGTQVDASPSDNAVTPTASAVVVVDGSAAKKNKKRSSKAVDGSAIAGGSHSHSYYMTFYTAVTDIVLRQFACGQSNITGADVMVGIDRLMVLYGVKSLQLARQQSTSGGSSSNSASASSLFNATRKHYARVLHLSCAMTACLAAISAVKAGVVVTYTNTHANSNSNALKKHKGSIGNTNSKSSSAVSSPSTSVFMFYISVETASLVRFLVAYRNVCLHTILTALQHQPTDSKSSSRVRGPASHSIPVTITGDLATALASYSLATMAALPNHDQIFGYIDCFRAMIRNSVTVINSTSTDDFFLTSELVAMQILVLIDHRALFVSTTTAGDNSKSEVATAATTAVAATVLEDGASSHVVIADSDSTTLIGEVFASVCRAGSDNAEVDAAFSSASLPAAASSFVQLVVRLFGKLRMADVLLRELTGPALAAGGATTPVSMRRLIQLLQEPATQAVFVQEYTQMFRGQIRSLWEILVNAKDAVSSAMIESDSVKREVIALRRHLRLVLLRPLAHTLHGSVLDTINFSVHSAIDAHLIAHSVKRQQQLLKNKHFFNGGLLTTATVTADNDDEEEEAEAEALSKLHTGRSHSDSEEEEIGEGEGDDNDSCLDSDMEVDEDAVPTNAREGSANQTEEDITGEGAALLSSQAANMDKSYPDYLPPLQCLADAVALVIGQLQWCHEELQGGCTDIHVIADLKALHRLQCVASLVEINADALTDLCSVCTKLLMYSHPVSGSSNRDVRWLENLLFGLYQARDQSMQDAAMVDVGLKGAGSCEDGKGVWCTIFKGLYFGDGAGGSTDVLLSNTRSAVKEITLRCSARTDANPSAQAAKITPKNTPKKKEKEKRARSNSSTDDSALVLVQAGVSRAAIKALVSMSETSFTLVQSVMNCLAVISIASGRSHFSSGGGATAIAVCQQICSGVFSDWNAVIGQQQDQFSSQFNSDGGVKGGHLTDCFPLFLGQADVWGAVMPPAGPASVVSNVFKSVIIKLLTAPSRSRDSRELAVEVILQPLSGVNVSQDYTLLVVTNLLEAFDTLLTQSHASNSSHHEKDMTMLLCNLRRTVQFILHSSSGSCSSAVLVEQGGRLLKTHIIDAVIKPFYATRGSTTAAGQEVQMETMNVCCDIAMTYIKYASQNQNQTESDTEYSGVEGDGEERWSWDRLAKYLLSDPQGVQSMWVRCSSLFTSIVAALKADTDADTNTDAVSDSTTVIESHRRDSVVSFSLLLLDTLFYPCEWADSTDDIDGNDFSDGVQHACEFVGHVASCIVPPSSMTKSNVKSKSRRSSVSGGALLSLIDAAVTDAELTIYSDAVHVLVNGVHRLAARAVANGGAGGSLASVSNVPVNECIRAALEAMAPVLSNNNQPTARRTDCCLLLCTDSIRLLNCLQAYGLVSQEQREDCQQLTLSYWLEQYSVLAEASVITSAPRWAQLFGCLLLFSGPGMVSHLELSNICHVVTKIARNSFHGDVNASDIGGDFHDYSTVLFRAIASRIPFEQWLLNDSSGDDRETLKNVNSYYTLLADLSVCTNRSFAVTLSVTGLEVLLQYSISLLKESTGSSKRCRTGGYAETALNIARYCGLQLPTLQLQEQSLGVALAPEVREVVRSLCVDVRGVMEIMATNASNTRKRGAKAAKTPVAEALRKAQEKCVTALLQCFMSTLTSSIVQISESQCPGQGQGERAEARAISAVGCSSLLVVVWNTFSSSALWDSCGVSGVIWMLRTLLRHALNFAEGLSVEVGTSSELQKDKQIRRQKQLRCESYLRSVASCVITVSGNAAVIRRDPQLAKNFPMIATCLIDALVGYSLPPFVKEIIFPSIFTLFDKFQPNPAKQRMIVHNNLTSEGKVVLAEMQEVYAREYKYSGQV